MMDGKIVKPHSFSKENGSENFKTKSISSLKKPRKPVDDKSIVLSNSLRSGEFDYFNKKLVKKVKSELPWYLMSATEIVEQEDEYVEKLPSPPKRPYGFNSSSASRIEVNDYMTLIGKPPEKWPRPTIPVPQSKPVKPSVELSREDQLRAARKQLRATIMHMQHELLSLDSKIKVLKDAKQSDSSKILKLLAKSKAMNEDLDRFRASTIELYKKGHSTLRTLHKVNAAQRLKLGLEMNDAIVDSESSDEDVKENDFMGSVDDFDSNLVSETPLNDIAEQSLITVAQEEAVDYYSDVESASGNESLYDCSTDDISVESDDSEAPPPPVSKEIIAAPVLNSPLLRPDELPKARERTSIHIQVADASDSTMSRIFSPMRRMSVGSPMNVKPAIPLVEPGRRASIQLSVPSSLAGAERQLFSSERRASLEPERRTSLGRQLFSTERRVSLGTSEGSGSLGRQLFVNERRPTVTVDENALKTVEFLGMEDEEYEHSSVDDRYDSGLLSEETNENVMELDMLRGDGTSFTITHVETSLSLDNNTLLDERVEIDLKPSTKSNFNTMTGTLDSMNVLDSNASGTANRRGSGKVDFSVLRMLSANKTGLLVSEEQNVDNVAKEPPKRYVVPKRGSMIAAQPINFDILKNIPPPPAVKRGSVIGSGIPVIANQDTAVSSHANVTKARKDEAKNIADQIKAAFVSNRAGDKDGERTEGEQINNPLKPEAMSGYRKSSVIVSNERAIVAAMNGEGQKKLRRISSRRRDSMKTNETPVPEIPVTAIPVEKVPPKVDFSVLKGRRPSSGVVDVLNVLDEDIQNDNAEKANKVTLKSFIPSMRWLTGK